MALAILFSCWSGVNGMFSVLPVGWFVGTVLSVVFYRKNLLIYRQAEEKRGCNFLMGESPSFLFGDEIIKVNK